MIKPAYSVSFLLSINFFVWQNVLYFPKYLRNYLTCNTIYGPVCDAHYSLKHLHTSVSGWLSDCLRIGRCGKRIPVGARFSAPVQTGPGVHPASYTIGTGSITGVKRPGRGVDHPTPSTSEIKERVELYRCATHNDISVKDGPHIRRWSHNIIIITIVLQLPTVFSTVTCCTGL